MRGRGGVLTLVRLLELSIQICVNAERLDSALIILILLRSLPGLL